MLSEHRWYSVQGALLDQIQLADRAPFFFSRVVLITRIIGGNYYGQI